MAILKKVSIGTGADPADDILLQVGENFKVDKNGKIISSVGLDAKTTANNVYFDSETITITEPFGKYKGPFPVHVDVSNMTIEDFIKDALSADDTTNLVVNQPSISITLNSTGNYEPGENITIRYTTTFNDGEYKYGPNPTGVSIISSTVKDNSENTITGSGTKTITVSDNTNYYLKYSVSYSQGSDPLSLLGSPISSQKIVASGLNATSGTIIGKRKVFYGASSLTSLSGSSNIRALTGVFLSNSMNLEVTATSGQKSIFWAIPSTVTATPSFSYYIAGEWKPLSGVSSYTTVSVNGANNTAPTNYKLYKYSPVSGSFTASTKCRMSF